MPREYSSHVPGGDSAVASTEGIDFTIDGVKFICHGQMSAFDLAEFAGPVADFDETSKEQLKDPKFLRVLSDFLEVIMGEDTYRAFTRHRRKHKTPDGVVQAIIADIMEAATSRHPQSPPVSPPGPETMPPSPAAASPSPAGPAPIGPPQPTHYAPVYQPDPTGLLPKEFADQGDVQVTEMPGPVLQGPPPEGRVHRVVNLGDSTRTRVEPWDDEAAAKAV